MAVLRRLPLLLLPFLVVNFLVVNLSAVVVKGEKQLPPKAIVLFLIDDLGWANVP